MFSMKKGEILKHLFSIDTQSSNRVVLNILGFKIKVLKKAAKDVSRKYLEFKGDITEIPKATGYLRNIQLADLKLMKIFDILCRENGLKYFLNYGNLLGAIRHKGFIPWDDDVDVSMMRKDYEKFVELYKNGIPNYEDLYIEFQNNGVNKCLLKLKHKKINNIAIDIFMTDFYYKQTNSEEKDRLNELLHRIINRRLYKLLSPLYKNDTDKIRKRFLDVINKEILKGNTVDESIKPSIFDSIDFPHSNKKLVFDYDVIFPLKEIEYEDFKFYAPNKPKELLTLEFGDYMKMPNNCYPRHSFSGDDRIDVEMNKFLEE